MIWNPGMECCSRARMEDLQTERLKETVKRAYARVPFYKKRLDEANIDPEDIRTLDDLKRIPFTYKDDLRDNYPYGMLAVPLKEIVELHGSSGTTGKATVVGYTKKDMETWAEVVARIAAAGGAEADDIAQVAFGYGLFTGAFGLHFGLQKIGATVIPLSSGNTERQIKIMRELGTTVLVGTPSYALYLAEVAERMGVRGELRLRIGLFGGEGHSEPMRKELEERLGIIATENYGMSEIIGPGVAGECVHKTGMHLCEDHFLPEIIDPETGDVLPMGETGELVLTTLTKEGLPMLRYRTRDITYLIPGRCECGRTSMRVAKMQGRSDDMLVVRGVNVFPSQIEEIILQTEGIGSHYEIIVSREKYLDVLEVLVEPRDAKLLERYSELERLEQKLRNDLKTALSIEARVRLVEPASLKRFEGKAQRVTDLRDKKE
ncbi:MAG: phenylacetate--CoA ligase family protein [Bacillota bacterium]